MAVLNRFTVDLVTEEPLSQNRLNILAGEITEWLHLLGAEQDDEMVNVTEKYVDGHQHDTTNERCAQCYFHARDRKNGDIVVQMSM